MAGGFHLGAGAQRRSSRPVTHAAPLPIAHGDRVCSGGGRYVGVVVKHLRDGMAECICASDGRRWHLPVAELRPAR
jgi:hypothetical protein